METNDAPKDVRPANTRGRKPSKWQLVRDTTPGGFGDCAYGVDDGINTIWWDSEKKAKAALAYARAFGYIPNDPRDE